MEIDKMEEGKISIETEFECPICFNTFPFESLQINLNQNRNIRCSTQKHDVCNECLIKWIRESVERRRDVRCVVCNEVMYRFQREEIRRENSPLQNGIRIHPEVTENPIQRKIRNLNQLMSKIGCNSCIGFALLFGTYIFLPPKYQNRLLAFICIYTGIVMMIMSGLYMNRLYYSIQLNRIHPS